MKKQAIYWWIMLALPVVLAVIVLPPAWQRLEAALRPELIAWLAMSLPAEERQQIRQQVAGDGVGLFQQVPDANVGRVARPDWRTQYKEAEVVTNGAGMRSQVSYTRKPDDVFRVICLGDSFVFGAAGREEDRFCDQMQAFYSEQGIRVDGKRIETLALGLPSWTTVQEASYLTARLDEYAPDVVIVLTVQNDIADSAGVTENGSLTTEYSIDRRANGSAVFNNTAGMAFGVSTYTALTADICYTCRAYWQSAFAQLHRLVAVQQARQANTLLSVLDHPGKHKQLFVEQFKRYAQGTGAPYTVAQCWRGPKTRLPHDGHPNRLGHRLLAVFYIHSLSQLGWIPVPAAMLPTEEGMQAVNLNPPVDTAVTATAQQAFIDEHLLPSIDFTRLAEAQVGALLGGFFPEAPAGQVTADKILPGGAPWASIRAGFLLRKPDQPGDATLQLSLALPAHTAMFPLPLTVTVNGQALATPTYTLADAGKTVSATIPVPASVLASDPVVEILLETPRHVSGITDHRMKSYQLLSAALL